MLSINFETLVDDGEEVFQQQELEGPVLYPNEIFIADIHFAEIDKYLAENRVVRPKNVCGTDCSWRPVANIFRKWANVFSK